MHHTASPAMKSLRVLGGHHAGAQLRLHQRLLRIGNDDEADIQITDWQHAPVQLINDEGAPLMWLALDGKDGQAAAQPLPDFEPRRFGGVVLCVGPTAAAWPSDLELLERLLRPAMPAAAAAAAVSVSAATLAMRPLGRAWTAGGAALALALAGLLAFSAMRSSAVTKPQAPLAQRVRDVLAGAGGGGLAVRMVGPRASVEGLLEGSADVARVRAALQVFGRDDLLHRYSAADDVARALADAAASPRVTVRHAGGGVFTVRGQTADKARLQEILRRVATDLGTQIQRLDLDLTQDSTPVRTASTAALMGEGIRYVELPGGRRHLDVLVPPEEAAGDAGADRPAAAAAPAADPPPPSERRP